MTNTTTPPAPDQAAPITSPLDALTQLAQALHGDTTLAAHILTRLDVA